MILPDGDFWAAKENILSSFCDGVILFYLNLDDVAGMFNHLADICLMFSTNFPHGSLAEIEQTPDHPELPENTNAITKRRAIRFNHAEGAVERPEEEKYEKEMVGIPKKKLVICTRIPYLK